MKKNYIIIFVLSFLIIGSVIFANKASAGDSVLADIQYPVKELGNCKRETDCKAYCDRSENIDACLNFAKNNNLMSSEEINSAEKFVAADNAPGGCKTKDACDEYCNDINHIDECVSFAEKNGLIPPKDLEEAKKVQAAIAKGVKPPACGNKKSCDAYCEDPNHMEECITFGVEAGFIQGKELEDSQKMLAALKRGIKPLPCKGKDACDQYCSNPDNMETCMNFAMEAGFMNEQEKADSQKMLQALKKGVKPPNCKGQQECAVYCSSEEHMEECINFSIAAGMMSEKDAEMARKTGGKGPGGCIGKEECEAFCNNPDNQETCFNFGRDNGMIPEEDLKRMGEGKQQMKQTLEQAPAEVLDCLKIEVGSDMVEKMKNGVMPPKEIGDKMQNCFQKMGPPNIGEPGSGGMIPPAGQAVPGGCKNAEECQTYCQANPDECQKFQPGPGMVNPGNQMMPQQAGPGGCKTPDECNVYCSSNPDDCKNFQPSQNQQIMDGAPQQFMPGTEPLRCDGENCPMRQQFVPGTEPIKCEGSDCSQQLPPPNSTNIQQQFAPGTEPLRCDGENCTMMRQQFMPGTGPNNVAPAEGMSPLSGQNTLPPPAGMSTEPGTGGNFTPGQQIPQAQPMEQMPPPENPTPPSSFIINKDSFVGSLIYAVFKFLTTR